ncbi:hypothetical protein BOV_A0472 [Brucella ovis ATCC 25840]|uniref:Uncharacterized protein n=1 Tax=Brucella ovis (strain ATCC 25840 / 63/290 / NCTC 10512) TaxID=444178 RepID=A0A0H3AV00_BRUO2|nr:hypothetical protein BOV_A0472 [Brucella ovis ATCC 25840]
MKVLYLRSVSIQVRPNTTATIATIIANSIQ